jgi:hypothetical protein
MKLEEQHGEIYIQPDERSRFAYPLFIISIGAFLLFGLESNPGIIWVSIFLILIGILSLLFQYQEYTTISTSTSLIHIKQKSVAREKERVIQFSYVEKVQLGRKTTNGTLHFPLVLVLKDGERVRIGQSHYTYKPKMIDNYQEAPEEKKTGKRVAEVIGVPFESKEKSTLQSLAKQFDEIITDKNKI